MEVLIVAATRPEIAPLQSFLEEHFIKVRDFQYQKGGLNVSLLITGAGLTLTAYALGRILARHRYDLLINAGIAGAFNRSLAIGEVVQVVSEFFGDLGAENAAGQFLGLSELGLLDPEQAPFQGGILYNEQAAAFEFLPKVKGVSVNKVHGSATSIAGFREKFDADVESMEGAAFFYACLQDNLPFMEVRAISNYVEPRNRENWNVPLAVHRLNEVLITMIGTLT